MKSLYQDVLFELITIIEKSRDKIQNNHENFENSMGDLILFKDKQFGTYKSIVETNEHRTIKAVESIAKHLFLELKSEIAVKTFPNDMPFQIILKEKDKKVGLIFCTHSEIGESAKCFNCGKYEIDALKIIVLSEPDDFAYDTLFTLVNEANKLSGINIERIPVLEFWRKYFGNEECEELIDLFNQLNDKTKEIIGFNTVITPTKKALSQFRERCSDTLIRTAHSQNIPKEFSSNHKTLKHNYVERQLWRAMIGNNNFAISFITSEWFYTMYQLTENLDLTTIVAGYLKSIEQLLFSVIQLSPGITIKEKRGRIVELTKDNEDIVDTTLGALENVIKYNSDILEINNYAKTSLVEIIDDWRKKQRNGYFHKHNLHSFNKVDEIREKALQLYFLILGSCHIKDEQLENLGIEM